MSNPSQHTYEEIRELIVDILLERQSDQWMGLVTGVAAEFARREDGTRRPVDQLNPPRLHPLDESWFQMFFGICSDRDSSTLGMNSEKSHVALDSTQPLRTKDPSFSDPFRFHDTASFIAIAKREVPDISPEALAYLDEAVAAFLMPVACWQPALCLGWRRRQNFFDCNVATKGATHGNKFTPSLKETVIRQEIIKLHSMLKTLTQTLQPKKNFEELDTNLTQIQAVLRIARNDAGHPTADSTPGREQINVFLQLFVPFARQLMWLRRALV